MDTKSKKCRWYHVFFCINVTLYGIFWAVISSMKSSMCFGIYREYAYVGRYPSIFTGIVLVLQILMLIFLLNFIKHTEIDKASYTRKIPSELSVILFALYTLFIYYLYRHNQVFSFQFEEVDFVGVYEFWKVYGDIIKEIVIAFVQNILIGSGYLWIITAITVKMKGRYWKEDSLLIKLFQHYNRNRVSSLRKMYFNDILFLFLQLGIILYENIASIMIINRKNSILLFNLVILLAIPLLLEALLILWKCKVEIKVKDIRSLVDEIHKMKQGQKQIENNIPKNSYLYETGEEIKNISINLYNSMQQQMKNEKLKVDLITNISHDLKTPLTSIIGYIDLLAAKDYLSSEDRHYVKELNKKAENLRDMIDAVFELSKASSGNIKIDKTKLNLNKLIMQTMADMEDIIANSGFDIKTVYSKEDLEIYGDGSKLYLVCQNLISNALKYSLTGSRIYIRTYLESGNAVLCIQNTSAYEIDFSPEEITGRFVRGDESRSDGGNGLGLAIAKTYSEVCDGEFKIDIDGDMFKVTIQFPMVELLNS
ncbi:Signal transduction histidine kinase [Anaerocolumna jejuensis DSM 15929]|uniref:histidine kinase n=2 Tax=Anaerocolumna TaxID=1843210 RepID=A0A1M7A4D5_9FIRM|nr:Signal transduction histidine kinase [Anaerocolumna jejuensis DSM 15929]